MTKLTWWLRIVGVLYVVNGIMMAFVRAPIRSAGPERALARAAAGDPTARFLVDTWMGFGLEVGAVGVGLLVASTRPHLAGALVWTVILIEIARGLIYDCYMLMRGVLPVGLCDLDGDPYNRHSNRYTVFTTHLFPRFERASGTRTIKDAAAFPRVNRLKARVARL